MSGPGPVNPVSKVRPLLVGVPTPTGPNPVLPPSEGIEPPGISTLKPGAILAVRTGGFFGDMIRFGGALLDEPNMENHIAVLHHQDDKGTWWCLEGRPGGVGWRDATAYLNSPWTITNRNQPLMDEQRAEICNKMDAMINRSYDWRAIVEDGLRDIHIEDPWGEKWTNGEVDGGVVCSSVAAYTYGFARAAYPHNVNQPHVQPADWVQFIIENNYA